MGSARVVAFVVARIKVTLHPTGTTKPLICISMSVLPCAALPNGCVRDQWLHRARSDLEPSLASATPIPYASPLEPYQHLALRTTDCPKSQNPSPARDLLIHFSGALVTDASTIFIRGRAHSLQCIADAVTMLAWLSVACATKQIIRQIFDTQAVTWLDTVELWSACAISAAHHSLALSLSLALLSLSHYTAIFQQ